MSEEKQANNCQFQINTQKKQYYERGLLKITLHFSTVEEHSAQLQMSWAIKPGFYFGGLRAASKLSALPAGTNASFREQRSVCS